MHPKKTTVDFFNCMHTRAVVCNGDAVDLARLVGPVSESTSPTIAAFLMNVIAPLLSE